MVFDAQLTVTSAGRPDGVPMPVAPVVPWLLVMVVPIHSVVLETVAAVLFGVTIMVPVALTLPQPPVNGIV